MAIVQSGCRLRRPPRAAGSGSRTSRRRGPRPRCARAAARRRARSSRGRCARGGARTAAPAAPRPAASPAGTRRSRARRAAARPSARAAPRRAGCPRACRSPRTPARRPALEASPRVGHVAGVAGQERGRIGRVESPRPQRLDDTAGGVRAHDHSLRAGAPQRVPAAAHQHAQLARKTRRACRGGGRSRAQRGRVRTPRGRAPRVESSASRRWSRPAPARYMIRPPAARRRSSQSSSSPCRRSRVSSNCPIRSKAERRTAKFAPHTISASTSSSPRSSAVIGGSSRPQPRGGLPSRRA